VPTTTLRLSLPSQPKPIASHFICPDDDKLNGTGNEFVPDVTQNMMPFGKRLHSHTRTYMYICMSERGN
jgi:hypothetical protein